MLGACAHETSCMVATVCCALHQITCAQAATLPVRKVLYSFGFHALASIQSSCTACTKMLHCQA
jgi:hypothetical protein